MHWQESHEPQHQGFLPPKHLDRTLFLPQDNINAWTTGIRLWLNWVKNCSIRISSDTVQWEILRLSPHLCGTTPKSTSALLIPVLEMLKKFSFSPIHEVKPADILPFQLGRGRTVHFPERAFLYFLTIF